MAAMGVDSGPFERLCATIANSRHHECSARAAESAGHAAPCDAGLWTRWRGVRGPKSASVEGEHELFGFLTTQPNAIVAPIHSKAMPVILTTVEALKLQRALQDQMLDIVARSEKKDPPVGGAWFPLVGDRSPRTSHSP